MGIIKRQGLKSSIVNYAGVLIGVVFFIFVFPNIISKEYLGLIGFLQNFTIVLSSIPSLAVSPILLKYYSVWKNNDSKRIIQYNAFAFFIMLIAFLITTILYFGFKNQILHFYKSQSPLFISYYFIVIPLILIMLYNSYLENYAIVNFRSALPSFLKEIITRGLLIVLVFLLGYHFVTEQQFITLMPLVYFLPFLILLFYAIKKLNFKASQPFAFLKSNADIKPILHYGSTIYIFLILSTLQNFLDGIILPAYLGLGALGIYMRPLVLGQMILVPYRAIGQIASPIIREAFVKKDIPKVASLNKSISINLFFIGCFLFTLLIANTNGIFSLLPKEYSQAENVLYIIGIGRLIDMAFGLNSEIITLSESYRFIVWIAAIMLLLTMVLNIIFIPKFGMIGAAMAVSISVVVYNILKSWIIYKKYHFHCFSKHYITLICISLFVLWVLHFVPFLKFVQHHKFFNSIINIFFKSIIGIFLFLIPTYLLKVSLDFNDFLILIITGKIFKGGHKMDAL